MRDFLAYDKVPIWPEYAIFLFIEKHCLFKGYFTKFEIHKRGLFGFDCFFIYGGMLV